MDNSLFDPAMTCVLSAIFFYTHFHFTLYQTSLGQAQAVSRTMEDVLINTARLFSGNRPVHALKPELSALLMSLSREARRLDDMTVRLPLKCLQRKQHHVLRHAVRLQQYLASHRADNEGEFFLFLHNMAAGLRSGSGGHTYITAFRHAKRHYCSYIP